MAAKRLVCWEFCCVQTNVLGFSASGQDCNGSTKLALISSYANQVAPRYIHPNMSLQIEGRWGNCHVLVADPGELGCDTKVTAVMNFIFVGYPAFPQEPHLGNNGSWHRKPYCKPIVVLDTEKSTSKDVGFSHRHLLKRIFWRYWDREQCTYKWWWSVVWEIVKPFGSSWRGWSWCV